MTSRLYPVDAPDRDGGGGIAEKSSIPTQPRSDTMSMLPMSLRPAMFDRIADAQNATMRLAREASVSEIDARQRIDALLAEVPTQRHSSIADWLIQAHWRYGIPWSILMHPAVHVQTITALQRTDRTHVFNLVHLSVEDMWEIAESFAGKRLWPRLDES